MFKQYSVVIFDAPKLYPLRDRGPLSVMHPLTVHPEGRGAATEVEEEGAEGEKFVFKTHGSVKGMWKYNLRVGRRFLLV